MLPAGIKIVAKHVRLGDFTIGARIQNFAQVILLFKKYRL